MRILVKCHDCKRRYNASQLKIGTKFRCRCGQVLTIKTPKSHTAAVVRCSSCGGMREDNSPHCSFCKADFTIHERDLHTVCPNCLARVSDRAKFCSECGSTLSADAVAGDVSKLACPSCDEKVLLTSRLVSGANVSFLECRMCAGLWMEPGHLEALKRKHKESAVVSASIENVPRLKQVSSGKDVQVRYRKCPVCEQFMNRRLYGRGSGAIIDSCRDHGVWFDDGELNQILEWIRRGGDPDADREEIEAKKQAEAKAAALEMMIRSKRRTPESFLDKVFKGLNDLFEDSSF